MMEWGERERSQLNAASIKLRFWWVCVFIRHEWDNVGYLSEWDMINIEVKALVSSGLRGMSGGELKES